jgi:hypothetical protein
MNLAGKLPKLIFLFFVEVNCFLSYTYKLKLDIKYFN